MEINFMESNQNSVSLTHLHIMLTDSYSGKISSSLQLPPHKNSITNRKSVNVCAVCVCARYKACTVCDEIFAVYFGILSREIFPVDLCKAKQTT